MSDKVLRSELERRDQQIELLQQTVLDLRGVLKPRPLTCSLVSAGQEKTVISVLMRCEDASYERLAFALHGTASDFKASKNILNVIVTRINKKIKPVGARIETIWGYGHFLSGKSKKALSKYIT